MKKVNIGLLLVTAGLTLTPPALDPVHAQAKSRVRGDPNVPTGYVLCNDGVAIAFEITGGGFGVKGAIDECNARHGGVAPGISNPRITASEAAPPRPDVSVGATSVATPRPRATTATAVSASPIGSADPRVTLAQTTEKLTALVATPKFATMQRARDYRGMSAALTGIGVKFEAPPANIPPCPAPNKWFWGHYFVPSGDGVSTQIVFGTFCGKDNTI